MLGLFEMKIPLRDKAGAAVCLFVVCARVVDRNQSNVVSLRCRVSLLLTRGMRYSINFLSLCSGPMQWTAERSSARIANEQIGREGGIGRRGKGHLCLTT